MGSATRKLDDKPIVITGGSSGIRPESGRLFATEGAGIAPIGGRETTQWESLNDNGRVMIVVPGKVSRRVSSGGEWMGRRR